MGIVRRQSLWNLIFTYGGVGLGYVNKLILFSFFLTRDEFGVVELLLTFMVLGSEFSRLGSSRLISRFFPFFKNSPERAGAITFFTAIYTLIGYAFIAVIFLIIQPWLAGMYMANAPLFAANLKWVLPMIGAFTLYSVLNTFSQSSLVSVFPVFVWQILLRLMHLVLILGYGYFHLSFDVFLLFYVLSHFACVLIILGYMLFSRLLAWQWNMSAIPKRFRKIMLTYGGYSTLTDSINVLLDKVDIAMLGLLIGEAVAGSYAVAYYIAIVILIPSRAMNSILIPLVSLRAKERNYAEIAVLYKKSSINNLILGGLFYIGIIVNLTPFFELAPKHASGKWSVVILGAALMYNAITSINRLIIINSRLFRFEFFTNLLLLVLAVFSNWLLIPKFGATGAAWATFITIVMINSLTTWYVYHKFQMSPFTRKTLIGLLLMVAALFITLAIPMPFSPIIEMVLRSGVVTLLFGVPVLGLKLSPDLNEMLENILKRVRRFLPPQVR